MAAFRLRTYSFILLATCHLQKPRGGERRAFSNSFRAEELPATATIAAAGAAPIVADHQIVVVGEIPIVASTTAKLLKTQLQLVAVLRFGVTFTDHATQGTASRHMRPVPNETAQRATSSKSRHAVVPRTPLALAAMSK